MSELDQKWMRSQNLKENQRENFGNKMKMFVCQKFRELGIPMRNATFGKKLKQENMETFS